MFDFNAEFIQGSYKGDLTINGDELFFKANDLQYGTVCRRGWVIELPDITKNIYISTESIIRAYTNNNNAGLFYKFVEEKPTTLNGLTPFTNISGTANGEVLELVPTAKYLVVILAAQYLEEATATGQTEDRTVTVNKLMVSYSKSSNYIRHEKQNIAMPCQQEMVSEEDYFDWENEKEVHGWTKKVFDGTENWRMPATNEENAVFENLESTVIYDFADDTEKQLSTHFEWKGRKNGYAVALNAGVGMYTLSTISGYKYVYFVVPLTVASTVEEWKAWLAEQYEAGTPLTNYYIATTPTELPFTAEQKTVAAQIKSLHSYKNVTHIFSTDEVPAIADVEYYKDLETELAKRDSKDADLQQQINNITELLSTTQTSALLLDNMQTDLESEVEEI